MVKWEALGQGPVNWDYPSWVKPTSSVFPVQHCGKVDAASLCNLKGRMHTSIQKCACSLLDYIGRLSFQPGSCGTALIGHVTYSATCTAYSQVGHRIGVTALCQLLTRLPPSHSGPRLASCSMELARWLLSILVHDIILCSWLNGIYEIRFFSWLLCYAEI